MEDSQIAELIQKYRKGNAGPEELLKLEQLLERGQLDLDAFHDVTSLEQRIQNLDFGAPSPSLDEAFYRMLADEGKRQQIVARPGGTRILRHAPRIAAAIVLVLTGVAVGHYVSGPSGSDQQTAQLSKEIAELKEMMMLSLLEKDAATERLRAVSLTRDMNEVSTKVTHALIQTLNHDENVNVRLAALEALIPYAGDEKIREELVRSIGRQESPLVQVALAELMAALQEKSSVDALRKIMQDRQTPEAVKKKIKESILIMS